MWEIIAHCWFLSYWWSHPDLLHKFNGSRLSISQKRTARLTDVKFWTFVNFLFWRINTKINFHYIITSYWNGFIFFNYIKLDMLLNLSWNWSWKYLSVLTTTPSVLLPMVTFIKYANTRPLSTVHLSAYHINILSKCKIIICGGHVGAKMTKCFFLFSIINGHQKAKH